MSPSDLIPVTPGRPYSIRLTVEVYDRQGKLVDRAFREGSDTALRRWRPEEGDLDTCLQVANDAIIQEIGTQRQEADDNVTQLLMENMGNPRGGASPGAPPPAMPAKICHAGFFQEEVDEALEGFTKALLSGCGQIPEDEDHQLGSPFVVGWERAALNSVKPEAPTESGSLRHEIYRGLQGYVEAFEARMAMLLYDTKTPLCVGQASFDRGYRAGQNAPERALTAWAFRNVDTFRKGLDKVPLEVRMKVFGIDPLNPPKPLKTRSEGINPACDGDFGDDWLT